MNRYLGVFVALIAFAVAVVIGTSRYKAKSLEAERDLNLARVQKEYFERVGWIRSIPDEKAYKDEVLAFFRWYFREVNEHLTRFRGNKNFDDYLVELKKRTENAKEVADRKSYYEFTRKFFDDLRSGNYAPVFSASDKGMRLDVTSAKVQNEDGKRRVRLGIALWGAQREVRDESTAAMGITAAVKKKIVTSAAFNVTWKLFDDKGKLIYEMNAAGDPAMKVDFPERYIAEFPPQMVLGSYATDLVPAEVAKMEVAFNVSSRAPTGGEAFATFAWKLDAPADWKLRPGEKWEEAEESVRSAEEVDPAAAARAVSSATK
jgi:hypothetical protein